MTVRVYKSSDAGAPSIKGNVAGGFIGVLDACLVNGYNSKSVTSISRSGSTATASVTAHGFVSTDPPQARRATFAGANETEYNGEFTVTVIDANTLTYTVTGTPATPATGTITVIRTGCGWAKEFSGTNKATYRASTGNRFRLRVDDTAVTVDSAAVYARIVGYESMSDVDTGTNGFPTNAQQSGGLYQIRSTTADGTARDWLVVATETGVHFLVNATATQGSTRNGFFGDFIPTLAGDAFNTIIVCNNVNTAINPHGVFSLPNNINVASGGNFVARSYSQAGTSVAVGKHANFPHNASATLPDSGGSAHPLVYPNGADGGLYLAKWYIHEGTTRRGAIPGIWYSYQNLQALPNFTTFSGAGALATKTFMVYQTYSSATAIYEISDTW